MNIRPIVLTVGLFALGTAIETACKPAQSLVESSCDTLIAYNDTPLEEQICATLEDMIALGKLVLGSRAAKARAPDAGIAKASTCQLIPHTDVCATDEELAAAITARKATK
jgi:hypothetical protein